VRAREPGLDIGALRPALTRCACSCAGPRARLGAPGLRCFRSRPGAPSRPLCVSVFVPADVLLRGLPWQQPPRRVTTRGAAGQVPGCASKLLRRASPAPSTHRRDVLGHTRAAGTPAPSRLSRCGCHRPPRGRRPERPAQDTAYVTAATSTSISFSTFIYTPGQLCYRQRRLPVLPRQRPWLLPGPLQLPRPDC
jgi:hypothetical protein